MNLFEEKVITILNDIVYKNWKFHLSKDESRFYLQLSFIGQCSINGEIKEHRSRKWFLSEFMTKSEIIQTVFKAILTAEEHETREHFKYKNKSVFGPHIDVDKLFEVCGINVNGVLTFRDQQMLSQLDESNDLLKTVFENGKLVREITLAEIRARLANEN